MNIRVTVMVFWLGAAPALAQMTVPHAPVQAAHVAPVDTVSPEVRHDRILPQLRRDGLAMLRGAGVVCSGPSRWDTDGWLAAVGTVAVTAGAALLDNSTQEMMNRNNSPTADHLETVVVNYGGAAVIVLLSAGAYTAGLLLDNSWMRETGLLTATALLLSGGVSTLTKMLVGRARPYNGLGNHYFTPFTTRSDFLSFPSGHTVVAFSVSGVLAERIQNPWASAGLYTLAAGVAASRIYTHEHWLSDVVFGGILSTAVARSLVRWYEGQPRSQDASHLKVYPGPEGVQLVWVF